MINNKNNPEYFKVLRNFLFRAAVPVEVEEEEEGEEVEEEEEEDFPLEDQEVSVENLVLEEVADLVQVKRF